MSDTPPALQLAVTFEYAHTFGELAPYFHALSEGRALAAKCVRCERAWFPPRMTCTCGGATKWLEIPGTGTVEVATAGPGAVPLSSLSGELVFALVRFDGAGNLALVRCEAPAGISDGARGRLARAAARGPHPVSAVVFVADN